MIDKLLGVVNDEAPSMRLPRNDMTQAIRFDFVEDSMELKRKCYRDTAATSLVVVVRRTIARLVRMIVIIVDNKVSVVHFRSLSRLLGLAAAFGAGFLRSNLYELGANLLPRLGRSDESLNAKATSSQQALRDHTGNAIELVGVQSYRLRAAIRGVGYTHGDIVWWMKETRFCAFRPVTTRYFTRMPLCSCVQFFYGGPGTKLYVKVSKAFVSPTRLLRHSVPAFYSPATLESTEEFDLWFLCSFEVIRSNQQLKEL